MADENVNPEHQADAKVRPKRRRRILLYVLLSLLVLVGGVVLARRAIVVWIVGKVIARENLSADYKLSGNLITFARLEDVEILPTDQADVQKISIKEVAVKYDLTKLYKRRLTDLVKTVEARDVFVELKPVPPEERKRKKKPKEAAVNWNDLFEQPLLFADRITAHNVTVISHLPEGDLVISNATLKAAPGETGEVIVGKLAIPKFAEFQDLKAAFLTEGERVTIRDLQLGTLYRIDECVINAGQRRLDVKGEVYSGAVEASMKVVEKDANGSFRTAGLKIPGLEEGIADAEGTFAILPKTMHVELSGTAVNLGKQAFRTGAAVFRGTLDRRLLPKTVGPFDGLGAKLRVDATDLALSGYAVDTLGSSFELNEDHLTLKELQVQRVENRVTADGHMKLPRKDSEWARAPFAIHFDVNAPNMAAFAAEPNLLAMNGALVGKGDFEHADGEYSGQGVLDATDLVWQEFRAGTMQTKLALRDRHLVVEEARLELGAGERVEAAGRLNLDNRRAYEGTVTVRLEDLSLLNPLLRAFKREEELSGSLNLDWQGTGPEHNGNLSLSGSSIRFGKIPIDAVAISGSYTPTTAVVPVLKVSSGEHSVAAQLDWRQPALSIHSLDFRQRNTPIISGSIQMPLDLSQGFKVEQMFPADAPLVADLRGAELDLEKLMADLKSTSPVQGKVLASLTAEGTLRAPLAKLQVNARELRYKSSLDLQPARLDGNVWLTREAITADATFRQPEIQPISLAGKVAISLDQLLKEKRLPDTTRVSAKATLPRSALGGVVPKLVPKIRFVEGDTAANVTLEGTIAQPSFQGTATLRIRGLRFREPTYPAIDNFNAELRWEGNRLEVRQFAGSISGGRFGLSGHVDFAKLTEPVFNLTATADNVLAYRNDNITARTTSKLTLTGPLAQAHIAGDAGITRSRFFRDIEILPIELPGKPAPKAPSSTQHGFAFPDPPLANWTFDVKIRTIDPFLVRGNLAAGSAIVDMHLTGTGKEPQLTGGVRLENFSATLPFSRLDITNGFVRFAPEHPFVPQLDLQGTSTLRGYTVTVYVYGSADDPKTVFSSEPPLPQEEIITLLATGTTMEDLTSSSDALAGRAAVLAIQSLTKKWFKKSPLEQKPFGDRLDVDIGGVDPRTGQQEISARFNLTDKYYILGELDVTGNVRARLMYLVRFK